MAVALVGRGTEQAELTDQDLAGRPRRPGTRDADMSFFGGAPRERKSRPLSDPRYVADVLGG
ncbi:MAG: hypothetical protein ACRDPF_07005 [Streptosporangiaceae bacterium]